MKPCRNSCPSHMANRILPLGGILLGLLITGIGLRSCQAVNMETHCSNILPIIAGIIVIVASVITILLRKGNGFKN